MTVFTKLGVDINAPTTAAGLPRGADMLEEMVWKTEVERVIDSAFVTGSSVIFSSKSALDSSLDYPATTLAWVVGDPTAANNGIYQKIGAAGTGSWTRRADLPYSFIRAVNAGIGTANAIVALSSLPIPSADAAALVSFNVTAANTGSATIAFNGGPVLTLKTSGGSNLGAGALQPGMVVWGTKEGANFRLLSDPATTAILTQVLAAQAAAELARDQAQASASSVQITEFATLAAAQAYAPISAPVYIRTAFRDTDQVARSGAKFKKNGTTSGDLVITLANGTTQVGYSFADDVISATAMGMKPTNTAAANMSALKDAIARTPTKGSLLIAEAGAIFNIDTGGGLSAAAVIDRKMTILCDGHLKMTAASYAPNPAYMFKITAADVTFVHSGTLEGGGAIIVAPPSSSTSQMPGLIYVDNVAGFSFSGGQILRQPCTGFMLAGANCTRARIKDVDFVGGPDSFHFSVLRTDYLTPDPAYVGSAHFGIVASGGGHHDFAGLRFLQDLVGGGRTINGIFTSGCYGNANYCTVRGCRAYKLWEKLFYGYGNGHEASGNFGFGDYGTADTEFIRIWGSDGRVFSNFTELWRGAVQVLDGNRSKIFSNAFTRIRATGINVQDYEPGYLGGVDQNEVYDNTLTWDGSAPERRFAVRYTNVKRDNSVVNNITGGVVRNNIVNGFGNAGNGAQELEFAIQFESGSPYNAIACVIDDNYLTSCPNGIKLGRQVSPSIKKNIINAGTFLGIHISGGIHFDAALNTGINPGSYFLSLDGGAMPAGGRFLHNKCTGAANTGIRNHTTFGANNVATEGNSWTNMPLNGLITLSVAVTTTATHGGIAPHAFIGLDPVNDAFGALLANPGLRASPSGSDVAVRMVNGVAAAGGEQGRYRTYQ
ncbi:hypothetical protein [Mesorhizobium sp. NPDC059025]|uniref:hypothetical protein n=1 Tax=unclassified Mesorhizobium TaxID=325217 RepID=UPI00369BFBB2